MKNEKNKDKVVELLMKLERKEIDQDTFNKEYDNLINSEEYQVNEKKAKNSDLIKYIKPICICFAVVLIILIANYLIQPYIGREYVAVPDLTRLSEPTQIETEGHEKVVIDKTTVNIYFQYEYDIKGKVLVTFRYLPTTIYNELAPLDVGIAWGYILGDPKFKTVKWINNGGRYLTYKAKDQNWLNEIGGIEGLFSHNHLIAGNDKVKKQMKKIKKGDYIEIKGYLVNAYWMIDGREYKLESSTTRGDEGNGACEIIYVTDIKWLKEKK